MKNIFCMLLVVLFASTEIFAAPFFADTFTNRTAGSLLLNLEHPTTGGYYWVNTATTTGALSYQLDGSNMVLKAARTPVEGVASPYVKAQAFGDSTKASLMPNAEYMFSVDWKSDGASTYSGPQIKWDFGGVSYGGVQAYVGGNYKYNVTGYGDSSVAPELNKWNKIELLVKVGPETSAGVVQPKYDVYVTPEGGTRTLIAANVYYGGTAQAASITYANKNVRLDLYVNGPNGVVLYDNVSLEQFASPQCGDQNHPYLKWDLNKDCVVNFADFAKFASNWAASY